MSEHDPLERAHTLSAQASVLLRPTNVPLTSLEAAKQAYAEASDLFALSATRTADDGAKKALELLTSQNRRLVKDVERRIASYNTSGGSTESREEMRTPGVQRRESESPASLASRRLMDGPSFTGLNPTSIASRLNPGGIPPFSLRPPNAQPGPSRLSSGPPLTRQNLPSPSSPTRSTYGPGIVDSHNLSPLVSSSSSDESYLNLGAVPDTFDPFSRFWGMLDNMLDNISNPVAFATAAVDLEQEGSEPGYEEVERQPLAPAYPTQAQGRVRQRTTSGQSLRHLQNSPTTESFYVVPKSSKQSTESSKASSSRKSSPTPKTPEELALENTSLRASLDALAVHAQALEKTNQALRVQNEGREKLLKTAISGVRREAHKAKQGQDLMRSQLLASVTIPHPSQGESEGEPSTAGLQRRVIELQAELNAANLENDKKQAQIDKYKDRFDRIKANARAKKESKAKIEASSANNSGRGDLDEPG